MNWKRIPKENSSQPSTGTYKDWKELLSVEGFHQCVYCSISEAEFGGIRNFHVEHYKPKSLPAFASLVNTYTNLFLHALFVIVLSLMIGQANQLRNLIHHVILILLLWIILNCFV